MIAYQLTLQIDTTSDNFLGVCGREEKIGEINKKKYDKETVDID